MSRVVEGVLLNITSFEIAATHIGNKSVSLLIQQFELVTPSQPIFGSPKPIGEREEVQKWLAALVALRNAESHPSGRRDQISSQPSQEFATQIRGTPRHPDVEILTGPNLSGPVAPPRRDNAVLSGSKAEPSMSKFELLQSRAHSYRGAQITTVQVPAKNDLGTPRVRRSSSSEQVKHRAEHTSSSQDQSSSIPRSREEKRPTTPLNSVLQSTPQSLGTRQGPATPSGLESQSSRGHARVPSSGNSIRRRDVYRPTASLQYSPTVRRPVSSGESASASKMKPLSAPNSGGAHALPPKPSWLTRSTLPTGADDPWAVSIVPAVFSGT
jgi:hypothetical protein